MAGSENFEPVTGPVTIVARRGTPGLDTARDLLAQNEVPHRWVDLDRDPLARLIDPRTLRGRRLPLVLFPDGSCLEGLDDYLEPVPGHEVPENADRYLASFQWRAALARHAGLPTVPEHKHYDVVIVGAGAGGFDGGGLRRVGRASCARRRAPCSGRSGRDKFADRELSRLPRGRERWPAG